MPRTNICTRKNRAVTVASRVAQGAIDIINDRLDEMMHDVASDFRSIVMPHGRQKFYEEFCGRWGLDLN
jgi:hypothetical protein